MWCRESHNVDVGIRGGGVHSAEPNGPLATMGLLLLSSPPISFLLLLSLVECRWSRVPLVVVGCGMGARALKRGFYSWPMVMAHGGRLGIGQGHM